MSLALLLLFFICLTALAIEIFLFDQIISNKERIFQRLLPSIVSFPQLNRIKKSPVTPFSKRKLLNKNKFHDVTTIQVENRVIYIIPKTLQRSCFIR